MTDTTLEQAKAILRQEDEETLDRRAVRLAEIGPLLPVGENGILMGGGLETSFALWEAGMAYVQGMWLSAVLASVAVVERLIASALYLGGLETATKMRAQDLIERAEKEELLTPEMRADLDALREVRNGFAHFQHPSKWMPRLRSRAERGLGIHEAMEDDAGKAIRLLAAYVRRNGAFP